jgi:hypothetical protein
MKRKLTKQRIKELGEVLQARARLRRTNELAARRGAEMGVSLRSKLTPETKLLPKELNRLHAQAEKRLGVSAIGRLQWLVHLSQKSEETVIHELSNRKSSLPLEVAIFARYSPAVVAHFDGQNPGLSSFTNVLAQVKRGLDSLVDTGGWILDYPGKLTSQLGKTIEQRTNSTFGPLEELYQSNDGPTEFLMRAKELVRLEGARLARCDAAECRRLFVRRKRGLFCDKKCAQRERVRLWRERHATTARNRL